MGEMLTLNGRAYACSTEAGAGKRSLLVGDAMFTTGACALGARADRTLRVRKATSWDSLCRNALATSGAHVIVLSGFLTFRRLLAAQVSEPPIHGEVIFKHPERDYARPPLELADAHVYVMGALAPADALEPTANAVVGISRVLYAAGSGLVGKDAPAAAVTSHAHGLVLRRAELCEEASITPDEVCGVVHISAQSEVATATLELFAVDIRSSSTPKGWFYLPKAC